MPPERISCKDNKSLPTVINEDTTDAAKGKNDSNEINYFVDQEGRYYYQPVLQSTEDNSAQEQTSSVQAAPQQQETAADPDFQTVTLVPSENSNGELSYVLVLEDENTHPDSANIKKEKVTEDVYNFEDEDDEAEEDEPQSEQPMLEEPKPKQGGRRKKKLKKTRADFTCNFCSYTSHRRYLLIRHMKSHSEEKPHSCKVCDRSFKTYAALQNHTNMHNGIKPHSCKSCGAAFTTSGELVRHVRYKHTHEKPHKCTDCDYASVELSKLRRHVRCHTGERPYQCTDCSYSSPDTFKLKRHQRTHTGEKPYKCDMCTLSFTQSNSLKAHQLIHNVTKKQMYTCELCPAKCGRKTDLRMHVQKLHTSDKPIKCKRCGKPFPDRYSCKMHTKTHEGEKCYKCDLCPYASTTLRHLRSHLLKHTDEKPFACDECDQTFRQKQLLRRHQNLYHNPSYVKKPPKEKAHTCHECNRTFAHKGNLIRHMAMHDPDSGYKERALALKIGRQKKVKYIPTDTLKVMQSDRQDTQMLRVDGSSELKRGEVVTVNDCDGPQYVVLEVIQVDDGSDRRVAVVAADGMQDRGKGAENSRGEVIIELQAADVTEANEAGNEKIDMEVENDENEEDEEEDDDMQSKMQMHRQNQEKAAAERTLHLEKEVRACFGFEEAQDAVTDDFEDSVIYELV